MEQNSNITTNENECSKNEQVSSQEQQNEVENNPALIRAREINDKIESGNTMFQGGLNAKKDEKPSTNPPKPKPLPDTKPLKPGQEILND